MKLEVVMITIPGHTSITYRLIYDDSCKDNVDGTDLIKTFISLLTNQDLPTTEYSLISKYEMQSENTQDRF